MSEQRWYTVAPIDYLGHHKFEFEIVGGAIVLKYVRWTREWAVVAPVFNTISGAAAGARDHSYENDTGAFCIVEIVDDGNAGWEIERTLPVLFLRGDMYRVVAGLDEVAFLEELANE